jgi:hypothetical protein
LHRSAGRRPGIGARARQGESVQRRGDTGEQPGIDQVRAAPSDRFEQDMGGGPAHRRRESSGERQRRDRPPRRRAEDAPERGEGRIVERGGDGDTEQHPHREIRDGMIGQDDQDQTERAQE